LNRTPRRAYDTKIGEDFAVLVARPALQVAGFKAHILVKALTRTAQALDAHEVKVASHEGQITDVKKFVDHRTRLEAAEKIFKMVPGMYAPKQDDRAASPMTVEIVTITPSGEQVGVRVQLPGQPPE
jgi:hypothetical protein